MILWSSYFHSKQQYHKHHHQIMIWPQLLLLLVWNVRMNFITQPAPAGSFQSHGWNGPTSGPASSTFRHFHSGASTTNNISTSCMHLLRQFSSLVTFFSGIPSLMSLCPCYAVRPPNSSINVPYLATNYSTTPVVMSFLAWYPSISEGGEPRTGAISKGDGTYLD
jgi:hypothetical protein